MICTITQATDGKQSLQTVTANMNVHLERRHKRLILASPTVWGTQENLLNFDLDHHHSKRPCLKSYLGYLFLEFYGEMQRKRSYHIVNAMNNDAGPPFSYSINELILAATGDAYLDKAMSYAQGQHSTTKKYISACRTHQSARRVLSQ